MTILSVAVMKSSIPMFGEVLRLLEEFWMDRSHVRWQKCKIRGTVNSNVASATFIVAPATFLWNSRLSGRFDLPSLKKSYLELHRSK